MSLYWRTKGTFFPPQCEGPTAEKAGRAKSWIICTSSRTYSTKYQVSILDRPGGRGPSSHVFAGSSGQLQLASVNLPQVLFKPCSIPLLSFHLPFSSSLYSNLILSINLQSTLPIYTRKSCPSTVLALARLRSRSHPHLALTAS
jgi:hypothetical protein